jgi:hypothetical protein
LQRSLQDAIKRNNGPQGLVLHERLVSKLNYLKLTKEFEKWDTVAEVHVSLLDTAIRELADADQVSVETTLSNARSTRGSSRLNLNATSITNIQRDVEQLTRSSAYLTNPPEEDTIFAQQMMDEDVESPNRDVLNTSLPTLLVNSFPVSNSNRFYNQGDNMNHGTNNGYPGFQGRGNGDYYGGRGQGRGRGISGRFQGTSTGNFNRPQSQSINCMTCGSTTHTWHQCNLRQTATPAQDINAPMSAEKFMLCPLKLREMTLPQAMEIVQQSTNGGNLKYQSEKYRNHLIDMLQLNNEQKKRANTLLSSNPPTPNTERVIVATCRLALSESVYDSHLTRPTPVYGNYGGKFTYRPQHVFNNKVLAYGRVDLRAAFNDEINAFICTDESAFGPEFDAYVPIEEVDYSKPPHTSSRNGTAMCLMDGGATPTVITKELVELLNLPTEQSYKRLGVVGAFGKLKETETVCWITLTFSGSKQITTMAVVVDQMNSPILIGQTDFKRNLMSHQTEPNYLTFGNHLNPTHIEHLMTEEDIRAFPLNGYIVHTSHTA